MTWRRHWKDPYSPRLRGKTWADGWAGLHSTDLPIGETDTAHDAQLSLPWTRRQVGIGTRRTFRRRILAKVKGRV
jgi:hypothetical protein